LPSSSSSPLRQNLDKNPNLDKQVNSNVNKEFLPKNSSQIILPKKFLLNNPPKKILPKKSSQKKSSKKIPPKKFLQKNSAKKIPQKIVRKNSLKISKNKWKKK
jgi:hypothetical protein